MHMSQYAATHTGINQAIMDLEGCRDDLTPGRYEWLFNHGIVTLSDIVTYTEKINTLHWIRHIPHWLHELLPAYIPTDQIILRAGQFWKGQCHELFNNIPFVAEYRGHEQMDYGIKHHFRVWKRFNSVCPNCRSGTCIKRN